MTDCPVMLLSGGSRGIGAEIARAAQARGWHVSLGLRDLSAVPEGMVPERLDTFAYDATERAAEARWAEAVIARHGRIDAIVASAGLFTSSSIVEASEGEVDTLLEVNLRAPRRLAMAGWEALKAGGRGRVVILGSLSGKRVASAGSGLYSVSKFAAVGLAHALRYEGWDHGIRATAVCPGLVATEMGETASAGSRPAEQMTQPEEVAHLVMEAIGLSNTASVPEIHINCRTDGIF
ncbi:SDR family NAD(P)-dependent oxidoreductase [Salipiger mangrovisoli]|uniref:SDR family NAD(P)-dependent oxidoreductase n=1 Tax=Salipiger mangrovisoli TaxID=2865933 RepID=A0ABR9X9H2_9RHOB|nr:SDR family NAD(P)-dependent oxidoreductase [Salipiger mangrovisoli]MBE9640117.1 SDR family NAD(P)-dependent oxidoreductase [Salipiger mangrovisoli]